MENNFENIPLHVAIIPDGNRRWAKNKGLNPWEGHEAGAKNLEKIIQTALKKGVKCLSLWGSSMDNLLKRPIAEKKALLEIYKKYFKRLLEGKEIHENEARVNVIGRWEEQFPESLKSIIREAIEKTKHYEKRMLNFMLAYSGTDDMLQAVYKINNAFGKDMEITPEMLKENLMTAELPPVDFMIRTGGEPHNSNGFLMWDSADAQLYFSLENFPDFGEEKFEEALLEYAQRKRRFGE
ncbi:MAG TPA: polyprenyl diphosphate synthase [Candidatus Moranbacteria bacterium]|nr:polyprenyl diphosphate synthase [Candidatus Moranbacteria bacterium]